MNLLNGKKTYLISLVGVAVLVAVNVFGVPIPGLEPSADWLGQALGLLGLSTLRAGVARGR